MTGIDDIEGAADVVDFDDGLQGADIDDDDDDDDDGAGSSHAAALGGTAAHSQRAAREESGPKPDFSTPGFCGDLMDQMSMLHPGGEVVTFKMDGEEMDSYPHGSRRGQGGAGGGSSGSGLGLGQRSVYADLVMPYGDPHEEGGQGIMSIPVRISVGPEEDNDDDDDDDKDGAA